MKKNLTFLFTLLWGLASVSCDNMDALSIFSATDNSGNSVSSLILSSYNGSATFNLVTTSPWRVAGKPDWITIPREGKKSATILVEASNNTDSERSGVITLLSSNDEKITITVKQLAFMPITPESLSFSGMGGSKTIQVIANSIWTISAPAGGDWIGLSANSGNGNASVTVTAEANPSSTTPRNITLTYTEQGRSPVSVNITQEEGVVIPPLPSGVYPESLSFPGTGGAKTVEVFSGSIWSITVPVEADWIHLSATSGNRNAPVSITADPNPSTATTRSATLTFTELGGSPVSIDITQAVGAVIPMPTPELNVYPASLSFVGNGDTKDIIVSSNTVWTVSSSQTWLKVSPTAGNGTQTVSVTAEENSSASNTRTAVLSFTSPEIATPVEVQITQNQGAAKLIINPKLITFGYLGGRQTIEITSNASYTITRWGGTWVSGFSSPGFAGTTTINLEAELNPLDQARTMTLEVALFGGAMSETITIYQEKNPAKKADPYDGAVVESIDYLDYGWDYSWNEMNILRKKIEETFTDNINLWPSDIKSAYQTFGMTLGLLFAMKEYKTQSISNEIIYEYTNWVPSSASLTVRLDDITEMGVQQTITASVEAKASVAVVSVTGSIAYASTRTVTTTKGIGSDYSWDLREYEQNKEYKVVLVGAYKVCKYDGYVYADGVPEIKIQQYSAPFIKVDESSLRILLISRDKP